VITVTLVGLDNIKSVVTISGNATVRGVVTAKYDLFCRIVKRQRNFPIREAHFWRLTNWP